MGVIDPPPEEAFPHGEGGSPEARRMRGVKAQTNRKARRGGYQPPANLPG